MELNISLLDKLIESDIFVHALYLRRMSSITSQNNQFTRTRTGTLTDLFSLSLFRLLIIVLLKHLSRKINTKTNHGDCRVLQN